MNRAIDTYIVEEHHEAFLVWQHAKRNGQIRDSHNTLLHLDEHSDMQCTQFNKSIHKLNGDLSKVKTFTYQELGIASFITPSIYMGLIDNVYWVRQSHKSTKRKSVDMYVKSINDDGLRLLMGPFKDVAGLLAGSNGSDGRFVKRFGYRLRTPAQVPSLKNVILDIDLDFFSCSGNPNEMKEIYIEITKHEYDSFASNSYHRLNFIAGRFEIEKKNGRYFYVINRYDTVYSNSLKVSRSTIQDRINVAVKAIVDSGIKPQIIDICRSRHSGYTPEDQWEFVERSLIARLRRHFDLDIKHISSLQNV